MCLAPTFKYNFKNTKKKKLLFRISFLFLRFKKKKLQKVTHRICKLLFCVDNDKGIKFIIYLFIYL